MTHGQLFLAAAPAAAATAALGSLGLGVDLDATTSTMLGDMQLRKQVRLAPWQRWAAGQWTMTQQRLTNGSRCLESQKRIWNSRRQTGDPSLPLMTQAAIASEDYDEAKRLKAGIQRCRVPEHSCNRGCPAPSLIVLHDSSIAGCSSLKVSRIGCPRHDCNALRNANPAHIGRECVATQDKAIRQAECAV